MTPEAAAALVLEHALSRRPTLGRGRLVCVDGPSGSGKSTLASAILSRTPGQLVQVDELFPGWDGFAEIPQRLERFLGPLAAGEDGHWQRYDWFTGRFAEWHRVRPGGLLVVEGVGSGHRRWTHLTTTLAWVEAPRAERLRRGLTRNDEMAEHWRRWQVQEDAMFATQQTRRRADVVVPNSDK
ncbi:MAG: 4-amino-4-deoxy-L-arabinose transferase [Marmoricola sp.]